jgi:zinc protease
MRPLVEKYLASLPSTHKPVQPKSLGLHPPAGKITKKVFKGTEQKAKVNLTFSGSYDFSPVNNKLLEALKEVLQIKLLQRLREQESGAYSPSVLVAFEKIPEPRYRLRIAFDCAPENVEKLIAASLDEVDKIKANGADEETLQKFKAEDRNKEELQLKSDFAWAQYIKQQLLNDEDLNEVNEYESIIKKLTKESIKEAANKYVSGNNLIRFILLPEAYKK